MLADYLNHIHPLGFVCALLAAAVMGFSIQQGGTCMVGAVSQLVNEHRGGKAMALAECGVWVLALGLWAIGAGIQFEASPQYPVGILVILGGVMLGLGAWLNDACVFGSIARIGKRDLNYLLTPPGYFLGSLLHARSVGSTVPGEHMAPSPGAASIFLLLLFVGSVVLSLRQLHRSRHSASALPELWDYRHATITIGIAFVVLSILAGPWTYTEVLARSAHGGRLPGLGEALLLAALLGGAIFGGRGSGRRPPFAAIQALRCLAGGALMGFGASLVPGGNDNLILAGIPWLQPHAWLAIAAMTLAIAAGLLTGKVWRKPLPVDVGSRARQL